MKWEHQIIDQHILQINIVRSSNNGEDDPNQYHPDNDCNEMDGYRCSFSKSFPHDQQGFVDRSLYSPFVTGIKTQNPDLVRNVIYDERMNQGDLRLTDPMAIFDLDLQGPAKCSYYIPPAEKWNSDQTVAEMLELYEMALCRDISFSLYSTDKRIEEAGHSLSLLRRLVSPKDGNKITDRTIFRGNNPSSLRGPYLSQLFFLIDQSRTRDTQDYNIDPSKFISIYNGNSQDISKETVNTRSNIINLRDGAHWIDNNDFFQLYQDLYEAINDLDIPIKINRSPTERLLSFGSIDFFTLLAKGIKRGLDVAWFGKWTHMKARPEEIGFYIDQALNGKSDLTVPREIARSTTIGRVKDKFGSYLLPQVYPDGASSNPSYPSAHSVAAGVGITLLLAWFDCDWIFPATYQSVHDKETGKIIKERSDLTLSLRDELTKFANNIVIFQCAAGTNTRSDGRGLILGERVAIEILSEEINRYHFDIQIEFKNMRGVNVKINKSEFDKTTKIESSNINDNVSKEIAGERSDDHVSVDNSNNRDNSKILINNTTQFVDKQHNFDKQRSGTKQLQESIKEASNSQSERDVRKNDSGQQISVLNDKSQSKIIINGSKTTTPPKKLTTRIIGRPNGSAVPISKPIVTRTSDIAISKNNGEGGLGKRIISNDEQLSTRESEIGVISVQDETHSLLLPHKDVGSIQQKSSIFQRKGVVLSHGDHKIEQYQKRGHNSMFGFRYLEDSDDDHILKPVRRKRSGNNKSESRYVQKDRTIIKDNVDKNTQNGDSVTEAYIYSSQKVNSNYDKLIKDKNTIKTQKADISSNITKDKVKSHNDKMENTMWSIVGENPIDITDEKTQTSTTKNKFVVKQEDNDITESLIKLRDKTDSEDSPLEEYRYRKTSQLHKKMDNNISKTKGK